MSLPARMSSHADRVAGHALVKNLSRTFCYVLFLTEFARSVYFLLR
jgi:hypothetical protein